MRLYSICRGSAPGYCGGRSTAVAGREGFSRVLDYHHDSQMATLFFSCGRWDSVSHLRLASPCTSSPTRILGRLFLYLARIKRLGPCLFSNRRSLTSFSRYLPSFICTLHGSLLSQNVFEGDIREFIEIAVEAGVRLYREKQKDDSTRKQDLNKLRGALDAVSHLPVHRKIIAC